MITEMDREDVVYKQGEAVAAAARAFRVTRWLAGSKAMVHRPTRTELQREGYVVARLMDRDALAAFLGEIAQGASPYDYGKPRDLADAFIAFVEGE